ncbi:BTB/POZ domain-containing protein KCTD4-like [Saccostrea echinata]|uniref:BTB/POZ domain-containing protein KCTD4-like n=1 Tax=Saccostrea echinata TaxID=191078 RepID=UPI002A83FC1A|nr:BTB/POZ domain-containing protein KCTD4-like [Saccostrea echinata]
MESEILRLNVGGHIYTTTRSTLVKYPDSMLGVMFKGDIPSKMDQDGNYFIDRDGQMFRYILNFCRSGKLCLPQHFSDYDLLENEADFYQIQPLLTSITSSRQHAMQENLEVHYIDIVEVKNQLLPVYDDENVSSDDFFCTSTSLYGRNTDLRTLPRRAFDRFLESRRNPGYGELVISGYFARIRIGEMLSSKGWIKEHCDLSSSNTSAGKEAREVFTEQNYRELWKKYIKSE